MPDSVAGIVEVAADGSSRDLRVLDEPLCYYRLHGRNLYQFSDDESRIPTNCLLISLLPGNSNVERTVANPNGPGRCGAGKKFKKCLRRALIDSAGTARRGSKSPPIKESSLTNADYLNDRRYALRARRAGAISTDEAQHH